MTVQSRSTSSKSFDLSVRATSMILVSFARTYILNWSEEVHRRSEVACRYWTDGQQGGGLLKLYPGRCTRSWRAAPLHFTGRSRIPPVGAQLGRWLASFLHSRIGRRQNHTACRIEDNQSLSGRHSIANRSHVPMPFGRRPIFSLEEEENTRQVRCSCMLTDIPRLAVAFSNPLIKVQTIIRRERPIPYRSRTNQRRADAKTPYSGHPVFRHLMSCLR